MAASLQAAVGADAAPLATPGARVSISPLLVLQLLPPVTEADAAAPKGPPVEAAGGSGPASVAVAQVGAAQLPAPPPRGALERAYWHWRLRSDLLQVDAAFLAFSVTQALLMASREGAAGRGAVATLLMACGLQLGVMVCAPATYEACRVPLVCAVRALHSAAGWLSQRALQAWLDGGALCAAGAAGGSSCGAAAAAVPLASVVQAVLACTGVGRLVLQPLGLQLPFRLALPFQLLDFAVARGVGGGALLAAAQFLEAGGAGLGTALHVAHDALDGLFHVSTALLFPGAYTVTLSCPTVAVVLLVAFLQLLAGCLLPLYWAYVGELAGKVRFVRAWAAREALSVRPADFPLRARPPRASAASGGSGGTPGSGGVAAVAGSGGSGTPGSGGAAGDGALPGSGSADFDGSVSGRSGGSWPSSGSSGERGHVFLGLGGPLQLLELESVSEGAVIAPRTHIAWLLLLIIVGWGLTSQLKLGDPASVAGLAVH